ncbi:MAG: vWA domain-containing protein [bacterium]
MLEIDGRSIIALVAALAVSTLAAVVLYRRTSPTVPVRLRLALGALRWLAAFLLLVMVLAPTVRLARTTSSASTVAVLVDDSRSMAYPETRQKLDLARAAFSPDVIASLERKAHVRYFTFSDTAGAIAPERIAGLEAGGSRTDLVAGLRRALKALEEKPSEIVLVTDGGANFGEDALHFCSTLKVPIHVVSLAAAAPTPDLSIDRVEVNETAYAGSRIEVGVLLSSRAAEGATPLVVADSAGEVARQTVTIPPGGGRQRIVAEIDAGQTGVHRFTASLAPLEAEPVTANNSAAFSVKVTKAKIRVALIAPHPSWDFAFAKRSLQDDPNVELTVVMSPGSRMAIKSPGISNDLKGAVATSDVVVVLRGASLGAAAADLAQAVWEGGSALLVSPDATGDVPEALNPFETSRKSDRRSDQARLVSPVLAEEGMGHEILAGEAAQGARLWSNMPPVPVDASIVGAKQNAGVVIQGVAVRAAISSGAGATGAAASQASGGDVPLAAVLRHGLGRVVGLAGYDLWKWDLVPKTFGVDASAFRELVAGSVRWLTEQEESKRLALATSKSDYLWGEPVALLGRVVDENLRPLARAKVALDITDRDSGRTVARPAMSERSVGNHSGTADLLAPGSYLAKAVATLDGRVYAEDAAAFVVTRRGLEDSGFDGDAALLAGLARETGGRVYTAAGASSLVDDLNPGSVITRTYKDLRVRLGLPTFLVLAGLLGVEWLIRRRRMLT